MSSGKTTAGVLLKATSSSIIFWNTCRPPPLMEWVWDSSKSKRWNQDMQRESGMHILVVLKVKINNVALALFPDERRLTALSRQLSQISHKPPSSEGAPTKSNKEVVRGYVLVVSFLFREYNADLFLEL